MNENDLYFILGVASSADYAAIRRAYHQLALRYHPDRQLGNSNTEAMMQQINQAAEILLNSKQRTEYDRTRTTGQSSHHSHADDTQYQGYDVCYALTLTSQQARTGTQRSFQFHASNGQPYQLDSAIPPGVITGTRLRLAGRGGPALYGKQRGDFYIVITVDDRE
jgi:curved DNA-binding protein